jgi:hypothetical protein
VPTSNYPKPGITGAASPPDPRVENKTLVLRRQGVHRPKPLDAGPFAADVASFRLHLAAENKAAGTSELTGIRYHPDDPCHGDVDLGAREITVRGKGGRPRTVKLSHEAARRLDRYLRARSRHQLAWRPELWLGTRGPIVSMRPRQHRWRYPTGTDAVSAVLSVGFFAGTSLWTRTCRDSVGTRTCRKPRP